MKQSEIFLAGEAQKWDERNRDKLPPEHDPVLEALAATDLKPGRVLEVGCGNGWRLKKLNEIYGCYYWGIDPLGIPKQIDDPRFLKGTASNLMFFPIPNFDLVIYGFCLYLCDPDDYFKIAAEGDRVLADGGHIIIYDFFANPPYKTPYKHKDGVFSHKMDFSSLWSWHPAYNAVYRAYGDEEGTAVIMLRKNMKNCFPVK